MSGREPVYVEAGKRWSYGISVEWPGWCRHARGSADPIEELLAIAPRYRDVLAAAGIAFEPPSSREGIEVVATLEGNSGTEFGVPSVVPAADERALDEPGVEWLIAILEATWRAFDATVEAARGHELRTGPRGGGRDLDRLVAHCVESDLAYLQRLGSRKPAAAGAAGTASAAGDDDWHAVEVSIRAKATEALRDRAAGRPLADPNRVTKTWLPRFYARYVAWHTLVHTWEIEDRRID